jgi:hypothetical protein
MTEILEELAREEQALSDHFQALVNRHINAASAVSSVQVDFNRLNTAQALLVKKITADARQAVGATELDADCFIKGLVTGQELEEKRDNAQARIEKIVKVMKKYPDAYDLFLKGTASRIDLYQMLRMGEEAERIKAACAKLEIDYSQAWEGKEPDLVEYAKWVEDVCGEQK